MLDSLQTTHLHEEMPKKPKTIRMVTADDVPIITRWWAVHREDDFYPGLLSDMGVMVEGDEREAVGFLYVTNSIRCFADFCIVNPALKRAERGEAIEIMMDGLINLAAKQGFKVMEINVKNRSLMKRCKTKGFVTLAEVTYMGKELHG